MSSSLYWYKRRLLLTDNNVKQQYQVHTQSTNNVLQRNQTGRDLTTSLRSLSWPVAIVTTRRAKLGVGLGQVVQPRGWDKYLRNVRKLCTDVDLCKQRIPFRVPHPSATDARNASTLFRFVMILGKVNLFFAVTPVREVYPNLIIFGFCLYLPLLAGLRIRVRYYHSGSGSDQYKN